MEGDETTPRRPDLVLYTIEETAEILRVSVPTIYRYIREEGLKAAKLSPRKTLVAQVDLLDFIERRKTHDVGRVEGGADDPESET